MTVDLLVIRGVLSEPLQIQPFDFGDVPFNAAVLHLEIKPAAFQIRRAKIVVEVLNIRDAPKMTGKIIGKLYPDDRPEVLAEYAHDEELWYRIGWEQYAAAFIGSVQYMEVVNE